METPLKKLIREIKQNNKENNNEEYWLDFEKRFIKEYGLNFFYNMCAKKGIAIIPVSEDLDIAEHYYNDFQNHNTNDK